MATANCPSAATLVGLGREPLDVESDDALERHIEECRSCQATLDRLARNDGVGSSMSSLLPDEEAPPRIPGFLIERELGRGGMSVVYQARQPSLNRLVALKVVRSGPAAGSHEYARWLQEARAFSRVRHDNVVRLYQAGEADGWLYLVLELVPGGTLQDRLDVPFAAKDAARLVETIAGAVAAIHRTGLLHLDLKPSNILLDAVPGSPRHPATPRVGDFGIAYLWDDPDTTRTAAGLAGPLGTPQYMAPEQAAGDRAAIGPRSDIYGLGALFYHLLTGCPPFSARTVMEALERVRNREPMPPRRLNPAIPRDVETICLKCLRKDPASRYSSAEALADDLRRWLDGRPIAARPVSSIEKLWRSCRRRPLVAALSAMLALTLAASFATVIALWRHAEAEWARAEDGHKLARAALDEILDLGGKTVSTPNISRDYVISCLLGARSRILGQGKPRSDDPATWNLLAAIDLQIGRLQDLHGRREESVGVFAESLLYWEKILRARPDDMTAMRRRWDTLTSLARSLDHQGKSDEGVAHWERAVLAGEALLPLVPDPDYVQLAVCRRSLAMLVGQRGQYEYGRALLESNVRMLSRVSPEAMTPMVALMQILAREAIGLHDSSLSPLPTAPHDGAPHQEVIPELFSSTSDGLPAEDWARRLEGVLDSYRSTRRIDAARESSIGIWFVSTLYERASYQRRTGQSDQASKTGERLYAFARILVARHPDRAEAHIAMSHGLCQLAKNAWQLDDRTSVERNWKMALDEALQALALDPWDYRAIAEVTGLQRKLYDLHHPS